MAVWLLLSGAGVALAMSFWRAWEAAAHNAASPAAIVLPVFAALSALFALGGAFRFVRTWRAWKNGRPRRSLT